jgi:hypothetical protein
MDKLAELFSSRVKSELLGLLFSMEPQEFHLREISRRSRHVFSAVQSELENLEKQGLVRRRKKGNRSYFSANLGHPFYPDLRSLVWKCSAQKKVLNKTLAGLSVRVAFVHGSIPRKKNQPGLELEILVIGDAKRQEVKKRFAKLKEKAGQQITSFVFTEKEFAKHLRQGESFMTRVTRKPRLFIVGNEAELALAADNRTAD